MSDDTTPSATFTRKPDDDVGKADSPPAGGGHQTPEQAAVTGLGQTGRSDADRSRERPEAGNTEGRNPAPIGGSSGGHSDQNSASGGGKVAHGHYDVEKDRR